MALSARLLPLVLVAVLAACSGPREPVDPTPPPPDEAPATEPAYETFDPAPYDAEPPPIDAEVQHDVPDELMEGTITMPDVTGPVTVPGYRVQVFSSPDKTAADDVLDEATGWWGVVRNDPDAAEVFPNGFPAEVYFQQPYYRVRLGAFEYRREAEAALPVIRRRFPEAFIVPDQITIGG